ncbi:hypothetical protein G6F57_001342 [Rhizopus arrhizus]|nr:hypothetical protein G6F30_002293 [Rhizopus arrhizus]KAG1412303.1 hypothetical protein G6F58_008081 [Rhizopus delemar]KAG0987461.1 hypothetical protein G6F29_002491 [Rhizopus arrhizus]KAG0998528.1 hypothetical protein G6F28_001865 [Rhizopus arrhizus]KAG1012668.1 hypothetical protein G6F27_002604 [Rhizopus arrhizus]
MVLSGSIRTNMLLELMSIVACNKRESQNAEAVSRPIQKQSKKNDCTAKMTVSYLFDFDTVSITYKNQHNLVIGSVDDLGFLYLSASVKQQIESCLRKGFGKREVRVALNRHFAHIASESPAVSDHRDQYIYCHAIYKSELSEKLNAPIFKKWS